VPRAGGVGARGVGRRVGEDFWVELGLVVDYFGKGGWVQPGRGEDVGAALFFEEEGEPEGEVGSVWGAEGGGFALFVGGFGEFLFFCFVGLFGGAEEEEGWGGGVTLNKSMLSNRWRGTTVTSSISARKATSAWVRPGGRGSAIAGLVVWRVGSELIGMSPRHVRVCR
jgi:hypothetical protein